MELKRILLAEDSRNDVELILSALADNNLANEVIVVRDGREALDYLYRQGMFRLRMIGHPAVVLLDIKMPKVSGLEVLQILRADPQFRHVPVVMLTSSREERDVIKGYELGANAYVVKPLDFQEFIRVVKTLGLFWAVVNQPPPSITSITTEPSKDGASAPPPAPLREVTDERSAFE